MTNQTHRRWGLLSISIVMFFATLIGDGLHGVKGSPYLAFWIVVGYFSYKGNIKLLFELFRIVVIINIGILCVVLFFTDQSFIRTLGFTNTLEFLIGTSVLLVIKVLLMWYLSQEIKKLTQQSVVDINRNSSKLNISPDVLLKISKQSAPELPDQKISNYKSHSKFVSLDESKSTTSHSRPQIINLDDEKAFELASIELETGNVRKGLWAKLWTESDGDDRLTKLNYIKIRVNEIQSEARTDDNLNSKPSGKQSPSFSQMIKKFQSNESKTLLKERVSELASFGDISTKIQIITLLGGTIDWSNTRSLSWGGISGVIHFLDSQFVFNSNDEFNRWFEKEFEPIITQILA